MHGVSAEAKYAEERLREEQLHLLNSNVLGIDEARDELGAIWEECRVSDWDGHGAAPVDQDTLRNAYCFLESLPLGFPVPSIGAEPSGALTFEWHRARRQTLTVSINGEGELLYAAMLGAARQYGSEVFNEEIPARIFELVGEVLCE